VSGFVEGFMHTSVGVHVVRRSLVMVVPVVCLPSGSIVESFAGNFGHTSSGMCSACIAQEIFVLLHSCAYLLYLTPRYA